ncbi:DHS-like NAD/FAD-binding domain-containing protein [Radiomyces spectabilis]|uniref:DHS-like NAD/FAD-binding domain-containing protein n=1 Tax=Radiomyces spectabilis TaxID=64574 RepID=UPI00221FA2ED|nr:DHS-like NAD/FAD-binding domain-containing protein [Radiomyces spectabilis]KAI8370367.1 DHS-like NAD/FAD-binding domain-containing protein [Radiomyces spectabilis]
MKVKIAISEPPEVIDPLITDLAACIAKSKRVLVITGAGISCSGGIPDFRSSDGLYDLVKKKHPDIVLRGKELFDAMLFRDEKQIKCFYTFMAELKRLISSAAPTPTHAFIQKLKQNGQLLRCYTQNIDCLEESIDLPVIQLHGSMNKVKCTLCPATYKFTTRMENQFRRGVAPPCPQCTIVDCERIRQGKRSLATGTLRPDVVLYNEEHPNGDIIGQMQTSDLKKKPDLMIVMGTSLKIPALKKFIKQASRMIHATKTGRVIFVNRTQATKEWEKVFDYEVLGDTDHWVKIIEKKMADEKTMAAAVTRLKRSISSVSDEDDKENTIASGTKKTVTLNVSSSKQTTLKGFRVTKSAATTKRTKTA